MIDLFSCRIVVDDEAVIVYLNGEIDMCTVESLVDRLCPLAAAGNDIIMDLSGLSFLGTAGLGAFFELQKHATTAGGSMRLSAVPAPVWRLLAVTGMRDRFTIVEHTIDARMPLHNTVNGYAAYR
jgi:anti-anti-sigma factor